MANKSIFASVRGALIPQTNARNHERAPAYAMTPEHRLAQIAMTGTMNATFYAQGQDQLASLLQAAQVVEPAFVAKTAIYARERGHMKDAPALLMAWLSMVQTEHFGLAFDRVIDNGKMLRTFVQIMRSGVTGRKSLGSRPKRMVRRWLEQTSDIEIMRAAVGQDPSLADVIKMVHPKPADRTREALYGWLIGKPHNVVELPEIVRAFEAFKADPSAEVPDVPFQMLTARPLTKEHWAMIGRKAGWQMLRMNLATFARQKAFEVEGFAHHVAKRLRHPEAIRKSRVLPYQLMAAHMMASKAKDMPEKVIDALHDAMEIAVGNVPEIYGRVVVCPDVSGSMSSPVTGHRRGATTAMRCIDIAALVAAAFLRANREARVLPFEQKVVQVRIEPRDTVLTNARQLAAIGGGGTNCSAPIRQLVNERAKVDLVVMVSDNESWVDANLAGRGTALMAAWADLKAANPKAKLVCIDIQPYGTLQSVDRADILNIGGFSDEVFEMIAAFAQGKLGPRYWAGEIEKIIL